MTTATRGAGRPAIPAEAFEHGDPRRYWRGCRCQNCKTGAAAQVRRAAYLRTTGRSYLRDPERAAQHVNRLRTAGMNDHDICTAAHIRSEQLRRIAWREGRIHTDTERRVLAVPEPAHAAPAASRARVPAHGTQRRLRALSAAGWPNTEIARRLECAPSYVGALMRSRRGNSVAWSTATGVHALYSEIAARRPQDHGVTATAAERARARASRAGWRDPQWWEDWGGIDDPNSSETEPDQTPRFLALAEDALWLERQGYTRQQAAERLGVTRDNVQKSISRARDRQSEQQAVAS
ncbi:hypothetical protein [Streptomyces sp. SBT349]|uniref:hypothetical protein n=1 Tax=Streptomyces sp. SBT349 TaxID=1580539 RepID=UPI00066C4A9F|nr:hypothetical protein [Streptomyces sp. SBT349]